jgi:hypothetical protein
MTWQYWWLRGHTEESARYGEVVVASGEKLPPGQLGYAQIDLGVLLILSGRQGPGTDALPAGLVLFRRLGDKRGIAIATGYLAHLADSCEKGCQSPAMPAGARGLQQRIRGGRRGRGLPAAWPAPPASAGNSRRLTRPRRLGRPSQTCGRGLVRKALSAATMLR